VDLVVTTLSSHVLKNEDDDNDDEKNCAKTYKKLATKPKPPGK